MVVELIIPYFFLQKSFIPIFGLNDMIQLSWRELFRIKLSTYNRFRFHNFKTLILQRPLFLILLTLYFSSSRRTFCAEMKIAVNILEKWSIFQVEAHIQPVSLTNYYYEQCFYWWKLSQRKRFSLLQSHVFTRPIS